jgi:hypothetical protein
MPDKGEHLDKCSHNLNFSNEIYNTISNCYEYDDWHLVVWFYQCVHAIESLLYQNPLLDEIFWDSTTHKDRKEALTKLIKNESDPLKKKKLSILKYRYNTLKELSESARYESRSDFNFDKGNLTHPLKHYVHYILENSTGIKKLNPIK